MVRIDGHHIVAFALGLLAGCAAPPDVPPLVQAADPRESEAQRGVTKALPIDVEIDDATLDNWQYAHAVEADLDGDGAVERVVIVAGVETLEQGTPLWEDGHQWAVFVDSLQARTLVYTAFVPHGRVSAAVLEPVDGRRSLLVLERSPYRLRALTIDYAGPAAASLAAAMTHDVATWLPER